MSKQKQQIIAFNENGDVSGDVAPDLGEIYGTRQRGYNKLQSSNQIVQNALEAHETKTIHLELPCPVPGDVRRLLQKELGINPSKQIIDFYRNLTSAEQCLYLNVWKVIKRTITQKEISDALGVKNSEDVLYREKIAYSQAKDKYEELIKETTRETTSVKKQIEELEGEVERAVASARKTMEERIGEAQNEAERKLKKHVESSMTKYDEIESKTNGALSSATKEFAEKFASLETDINRLKEVVRKETETARSEVSQNIQDVKSNAVGQIGDFIKSREAECEELTSKLQGLLTSATIGSLSEQFEKKRRRLNIFYWCTVVFFYLFLCGFVVIGGVAIKMALSLVTEELAKNYGAFAFVFKMPGSLIKLAPFYIPLLWATIHMNKLMNQNHRLTEEYSHKVVVAETYMGIAKQIEELEQKGVKQADALSLDLLISTIRVLCANPNLSLDKVKTQTPISEVLDNAGKLLNVSAELKKRVETNND